MVDGKEVRPLLEKMSLVSFLNFLKNFSSFAKLILLRQLNERRLEYCSLKLSVSSIGFVVGLCGRTRFIQQLLFLCKVK